jgi:hypothetical protein
MLIFPISSLLQSIHVAPLAPPFSSFLEIVVVAWLLNAVSRQANSRPSTRNPLSAQPWFQATQFVAPPKVLPGHLFNQVMVVSVTRTPSNTVIIVIRLRKIMV